MMQSDNEIPCLQTTILWQRFMMEKKKSMTVTGNLANKI